ncbi:RodZ domain-containing protein [Pseudomonas sp. LRF_L74]|uniref:RodZ domain-containing protein n=1 Tax=Pseudomonas sp. LRF_L74 TaxID=3369422 RepID=UPI003F60791D
MKTSHAEAGATSVNPGETLRAAREARGWALGDVAAQLNLTVQSLRQLEAGEFDQLPGHTFARGYLRAYAKLLEMDQASLVAAFDQYTGSNASGSDVHSLGRIEEPVRLSQNLLKIVTLILLVALAVGAFFWWQDSGHEASITSSLGMEHVEVDGADGTTEIHPLDEPEDQAVADAQPESGQPVQLSPELAAQPEVPTVADAPVDTQVSPAGATPPAQAPLPTQPVAPAVSAAPANAQAVQTTPAAPAQGEVKVGLQFSADCWTQLTDANGKILLSALKRSGESVELVGKQPMELRLGYARAVQVQLNGQPFDIAPFVRGETARVQLGAQQ